MRTALGLEYDGSPFQGWQTQPAGNTVQDASEKLQYDLFYIKYQSVLFDFSILFNTIKIVVLRKGT